MRKDSWFRGAPVSVLVFALITIGFPPMAVATDGEIYCAENGICAMDVLMDVVADSFPWLMNPFGGNPLGGDLGFGAPLGPVVDTSAVQRLIVNQITQFAGTKFNELGGTVETVCSSLRSEGPGMTFARAAVFTLALTFGIARLAARLGGDEDGVARCDDALSVLAAGAASYGLARAACSSMGY